MNPQEIQQVVAYDEKWVPSVERVKISSTNVRLEMTVLQKEDTFQVVIDIIKNSTCFKAFTISVDVSEIFMKQFWYTIKKVQDTDSYEFLLANKKCIVNPEVFRTFLDICPRVEGVDFTDVLDDDTTLTFLIDLGYKESKIKPEPTKKKTSSKRRVKKKVTLSADDNIISNDPDVALELAKSINQTKAEEAEAARKVHATHARIVTEYVSESAKKKSRGRSSKSVVIQDTPSALKSKPATSKTKLKGASSLTPQEQEATDIMQALKESKKTIRRQLSTRGSNEGTGSKPGVPDESTGDKQDNEFYNDDNDDVEKDNKDGDVDDEGDDHVSDTQDADDEDVETEFDEDEIYNTVKDSADTNVSSLLDIPIQQETPQTQNPANHRLYHALIEALIEDENVMDKGVANIVKDYKRKHDDDEDDDDED
nr:hypothetical protein [Tanacetum cinerariifolium]